MATVDSRAMVDQLIAGKGRIDPEDAPDNPWCDKIVEYDTPEGANPSGHNLGAPLVPDPAPSDPTANGESKS